MSVPAIIDIVPSASSISSQPAAFYIKISSTVD